MKPYVRLAQITGFCILEIFHLILEYILNKCGYVKQCSGGLRSFTGDKSLKMGALWLGIERWQWPIENNHWRIPFTTALEAAPGKNSALTTVWSLGIWTELERWKSFNKCVPHELTENQRNHTLLKCLLLLYTTMKHFSIGLLHAMKSRFYKILVTTAQWLEPRSSSKTFPKAKVAPKKVMVTLVVCYWWSTTTFWILVKLMPASEKYAQQIRDVSRIATPVASNGQQKEPTLLHDNAPSHAL